ncbi:hypothetical protein L1987_38920 [Smallanthus sonchifolius]|uniref:Uncharacterized protein n=1 Tax=Smallanthus sonchifolius TaxID=185202 RepID=A0ACB9HJZ7_9ASTR|nr:hypothetical protein L1987_38920 [Smallanthus sonchifolius]
MEVIHGRHNAFTKDVISNMPDIVITSILDRLPLQDAVRTGVLSRIWRFKWTMLSKLVFDKNFFAYLSKTQGKNNHVTVIGRILLHLRCAIAKFVLSVEDTTSDAEHINHWILFLSRKGIKDLTLKNTDETPLKFPTHLLLFRITSSSSIFELVASLPKLQELDLDFLCSKDPLRTPAICFPERDYNTMRLWQLQSVVFTDLKASENEVCLIKYLLACSPILKKVVIRSGYSLISSNVKLTFARKLLKLHRTSPVVEIDLY